MTVDLCREIYAFLSERCDCDMVARNMLHVVPSSEITVSVRASVRLSDPDKAAITQQNIEKSITGLIENVWRKRDIGEQININELYQAIKSVENVASVTRVLPEGSYYSDGRRYLASLDDQTDFPFATVKNGAHSIRIG